MHALGACGLGSTPSSPNTKVLDSSSSNLDTPKMKKDYCTLYIIRHGETEGNRNHIVMGHSDAPLTEAGVYQAGELATLFKSVDFSAVYSSDSPRSFRTANIVIGGRSLPIEQSARLRERHFSRFEGMPSETFKEMNKDSFVSKEALPEHERWEFKIAGCVESDASLVERVISELRKIASIHLGKKVLVSTHGGPVRHLLMKFGFAPYDSLPSGSFKNCGYIVMESNGTEFIVKEVHGIKKHESDMRKFRGVIIEESLSDKKILNQARIISTETQKVTLKHNTPDLSQWTLHTVEIDADLVEELSKELSANIRGTWYADFDNGITHYIIYPNKVFRADMQSKERYDKAKAYGISLGIPPYQVDFHPLEEKWKRE